MVSHQLVVNWNRVSLSNAFMTVSSKKLSSLHSKIQKRLESSLCVSWVMKKTLITSALVILSAIQEILSLVTNLVLDMVRKVCYQ